MIPLPPDLEELYAKVCEKRPECDQRGGKVVPVKGHAARAAVDANNDLGEQSDHPVNEGAD